MEGILGPTNTRRQHYVPRFYLAMFTDSGGRVRAIDLDELDKDPRSRNKTEFRTHVTEIAVEKDFYNIDIEGQSVSAEDWLAENVEGPAAPVLRKLDVDPRAIFELTDDEEAALARFLATLGPRVPAYRERAHHSKEEMVRVMKEATRREVGPVQWDRHFRASPDADWLPEGFPASTAEASLTALAHVEFQAKRLRTMHWELGVAPALAALYTTDNPMAGHMPPMQTEMRSAAYISPNFYVPLSSRLLLRVAGLPWEPNPGRGERTLKELNPWHVAFASRVQSAGATRWAFGNSPVLPRKCALNGLRRRNAWVREHFPPPWQHESPSQKMMRALKAHQYESSFPEADIEALDAGLNSDPTHQIWKIVRRDDPYDLTWSRGVHGVFGGRKQESPFRSRCGPFRLSSLAP